MKVLIIDNNTAFLNVFAKLLEIKGFDVTAETTLKVGLKHLENKSYPIIFVDAPLDNYTENQILMSLSKSHVFKNSNVFLFSSVEFNDVELSLWRKEGLYSYLKKPVERSTIMKALSEVRAKINNTSQVQSDSQDEEATPEQLEKLSQLKKQIQELESLHDENFLNVNNLQSKKYVSVKPNDTSNVRTFKNIISDLKSLQLKFESGEQFVDDSSTKINTEQDKFVKKKLKETLNELSRLKNEIQYLEEINHPDSKPNYYLLDNEKKSNINKKPARVETKKSNINKKPARVETKKSSKSRKR